MPDSDKSVVDILEWAATHGWVAEIRPERLHDQTPIRLRVEGQFGTLYVRADSVREAFAGAVPRLAVASKEFRDWYYDEDVAAMTSAQL